MSTAKLSKFQVMLIDLQFILGLAALKLVTYWPNSLGGEKLENKLTNIISRWAGV